MVSLSVNGLACEISNASLTLRMSQDGKATSLVVDGRELLCGLSGAEGDPDRDHSFYCDYHVNGKTRNLIPTRLDVIANTSELAHVAYVDDESDLKLAYHLVVSGDNPCVYGYVIASCDVPGVVINELRTVYRFDSSLFTCGYTAERQGIQPRAEYLSAAGKWLQDETYLLPDGGRYSNSNVYSKYDYAGYFAQNSVWGQYSGGRTDDEWGAWFIPMDKSCYPGGPLKQELLVHYDAIILNYLTGAHFGTGDFEVPCGWSKLYGPWCMYFNHGSDPVDDALARAASEVASMPVPWMNEGRLYSRDYASVSGSIALVHQVPRDAGWRVVATDQQGEYFRYKAGRIYYCDTEGDSFKLEGMQPGTYWLYAKLNSTCHASEFCLGKVSVSAGEYLDMGEVSVTNAHRPLVWALGYATGTTEPFVFSDQLRNYVWMGLTPKNLTCRANTDDEWYYLQRAGGVWRVVFNQPEPVSGRYLLTVCLAGTTAGAMVPGISDVGFEVSLNGRVVASERFENDRAAYRSSVTGGRPAKIEVALEAGDLLEENETSFTTDGYVMYDMVKLEVL